MASRKKDLEIIYNLQWKNKPTNGGDKTSVIGVYDIPATTLNWELFKSYLLKNSGTTGDDVIVSYCTENGKEYPIQSQTDFQVALYAFRNKARNGEIINLKLDRISELKPPNRHSNDVETQFDNMDSIVSLNYGGVGDTPPEWFLNYMSQFKKDVNEEITATVSSVLSSALADLHMPQTEPPVTLHPFTIPLIRSGSKSESKKLRKSAPALGETNSELSAKQLIKSYKFDCKLEKLEHRIAKYKEKRGALFQAKSGDEPGPSRPKGHHHGHKKDKESHKKDKENKHHKKEQEKVEKHKSKSTPTQKPEEAPKQKTAPAANEDPVAPPQKKVTIDAAPENNEGRMDAAPVNCQSVVPHMLGGEVYLHQWEVMNTGTAPWTSKTSLQFTWGSKALVPLDDVISVPYLKPGDKGSVAVRLQIPKESGTYECYWHFMHKGRRFGHWLGCQIVVDPFDLKGNSSVLDTSHQMVNNYSTFVQQGELQSSRNQTYAEFFREKYGLLKLSAQNDDKPVKENGQPDVKDNVECHADFKALHESLMRSKDNIADDADFAKALHESLMRSIEDRKEQQEQDSSDTDSDTNNLKPFDPSEKNCSSDSDNQSVASTDSSVSSKEEFVVVPVPDCFLLDGAAPTKCSSPPTSSSLHPEGFHRIVMYPHSIDGKEEEVIVVQKPVNEEAEVKRVAEKEVEEFVGQSPVKNEEEVCDDNNNSEGSVKSGPRDSSEKDMVFISVPNDQEGENGYIYVYVDGQRVPIPKKMLKSEYLPKATSTPSNTPTIESSSGVQTPVSEKAPSSSSTVVFAAPQGNATSSCPAAPNKEEDGYQSDVTNYLSHCSAAGSCFSDANNQFEPDADMTSSRLFIFPQNRPGYEVVQPDSHGRRRSEVVGEAVDEVNLTHVSPSAPQNAQTGPANNGPSAPDNHQFEQARPVHILPENLVSGAVNVASSAINTARTVINMMTPREQPGRWVDGHWVSTKPETPREANLHALAEMGFWNRDLNATLLARYNDDLQRVVAELVQ